MSRQVYDRAVKVALQELEEVWVKGHNGKPMPTSADAERLVQRLVVDMART